MHRPDRLHISRIGIEELIIVAGFKTERSGIRRFVSYFGGKIKILIIIRQICLSHTFGIFIEILERIPSGFGQCNTGLRRTFHHLRDSTIPIIQITVDPHRTPGNQIHMHRFPMHCQSVCTGIEKHFHRIGILSILFSGNDTHTHALRFVRFQRERLRIVQLQSLHTDLQPTFYRTVQYIGQYQLNLRRISDTGFQVFRHDLDRCIPLDTGDRDRFYQTVERTFRTVGTQIISLIIQRYFIYAIFRRYRISVKIVQPERTMRFYNHSSIGYRTIFRQLAFDGSSLSASCRERFQFIVQCHSPFHFGKAAHLAEQYVLRPESLAQIAGNHHRTVLPIALIAIE